MSDPFPSSLPLPDEVPPTGNTGATFTTSATTPVSAPSSLSAPFGGDADIPLDDAGGDSLTDPGETRPMDGLIDLIRGEFKPVEKAYSIATRPGLALLLRTDVSSVHLTEFRRRATIKKAIPGREAEQDQAKFSALLLGTYTICLLKDGVEVHRSDLVDGAPDERVHFGHKELLNQLGAKSRAEGVRLLFGQDGPLMSMGTQLLSDSGMLDEPDEAELMGPTDGP